MTSKAPKPGRRRLVLLVWILVAAFYFSLAYDYIRVSMSDSSFREYLQYVVQVSGAENRPASDVRRLILVKAGQLDLPVRQDQITVVGLGSMLNVSVAYDVSIDVPVFRQSLYRKLFQHNAQYHRPF